MAKKFSSRLLVMAGLVAGFVASPAMATTFNLGPLTNNVVYGLGNVIASKTNPSDTIYFGLGTVDALGEGLTVVPKIVITPKLTSYLTNVTADL